MRRQRVSYFASINTQAHDARHIKLKLRYGFQEIVCRFISRRRAIPGAYICCDHRRTPNADTGAHGTNRCAASAGKYGRIKFIG